MAHFEGNGKDNIINGGNNADGIYGRGGKDWLYGNGGDDFIDGGIGADFLFGGDGNDLLFGNKGNDTMEGGLGSDQYRGGQGIDTVDYSSATSGITVYFVNDTANGYADGDTFVNVENLVGTAYADYLQAGDNGMAKGGAGNDHLFGASYTTSGAAGIIRGDAGFDNLNMTYGNTTAWVQFGQGYDTIYGFVEDADMLMIDLSEFGLGNALDAAELVNSNSVTAVGGNAQFIYEGDAELLWFDQNGSGAGGLTLIAEFDNSTIYTDTLDLADFHTVA